MHEVCHIKSDSTMLILRDSEPHQAVVVIEDFRIRLKADEIEALLHGLKHGWDAHVVATEDNVTIRLDSAGITFYRWTFHKVTVMPDNVLYEQMIVALEDCL